jgi:hypothetical protein
MFRAAMFRAATVRERTAGNRSAPLRSRLCVSHALKVTWTIAECVVSFDPE